ncbi:MAG: thioesterase family protein [Cyanobacteria bacterium P01_A01_bin.105]
MPYWFDYPFRVQPHHTDYSGVVWHGNYIQWMESARVECLRTLGLSFESFVAAGYDLPVVDLQLRYHRALSLGMAGVVKARADAIKGVRLCWTYEIHAAPETQAPETQAPETQAPETQPAAWLCITGQVTLVPVDMAKRKIARRLPPDLQAQLDTVRQYFSR